MSLKPMCCIHYGIFLQAHSTHIWHHPPQHSLPVSFDTVARELPPRTKLHRFASWKRDVPFIIQMLIALREAREALGSQTQLSFSSRPPPLKPATVKLLKIVITICWTHLCISTAWEFVLLKLSQLRTKSSCTARGRKKKSHDKRCLFIDIYLLVFTHLITQWWLSIALSCSIRFYVGTQDDGAVTGCEKEGETTPPVGLHINSCHVYFNTI